MSHAREITLSIDFLKNPSKMPLGVFLVLYYLDLYVAYNTVV